MEKAYYITPEYSARQGATWMKKNEKNSPAKLRRYSDTNAAALYSVDPATMYSDKPWSSPLQSEVIHVREKNKIVGIFHAFCS